MGHPGVCGGEKDGSNGNDKSDGQGEMRGSLHCATHDETVSRFGRDDDSLGREKKKTAAALSRAGALFVADADLGWEAGVGGDALEEALALLKLLVEVVGEDVPWAGGDAGDAASTELCTKGDELLRLETGSDFSMRLLMRVKMAVLAPMPRASERMATVVKPGLLAIMRRL
jgi:hypothetical protein